jgi:ferredoxin--NADP+ reductase
VSTPGSPGRPLRVAVVGAGPAGFYTVEALLKHREIEVEVDLVERLPAPYGLLRYGVAPDHPKIKGVSLAYDRLCDDPRVRFLGNVTVGSQAVSIDDLARCYDQVVVATGCEADRRLGIPGEHLAGSHSATSFVAWYNGHPDYAHLSFDLSTERAVVVGIGDVAMDLARILLRDPHHADLATTDIASYALDELRRSRVREVVILARRGPAEAAFAAKELEDIAALPGVAVDVDGPIVAQALAAVDPHAGHEKHKLEVLARLAETGSRGAERRLAIRFLASPVAIHGEEGRAAAIRVERNELVVSEAGQTAARGTGEHDTIATGLVLRSIGYLGVPIPGLPFDEKRGLVPNVEGRVESAASRVYVAGWIKRGASGVVGTNKGDAASTVLRMLEDVPSLDAREPAAVSRSAVDAMLAARDVEVVHWHGWKRIDSRERERGAALGKVREKLTVVRELLDASKEEDPSSSSE